MATSKKVSTFWCGKVMIGEPNWKHSELFFEKKQLIPSLQQLLISYWKPAGAL